jgi:hypothetical protein
LTSGSGGLGDGRECWVRRYIVARGRIDQITDKGDTDLSIKEIMVKRGRKKRYKRGIKEL